MKSFIMMVFLGLTSLSQGYADTLVNRFVRDQSGIIENSLQMECTSSSKMCQNICKANKCVIPKKICTTCNSDQDLTMRSLIQDPDRRYERVYNAFDQVSLHSILLDPDLLVLTPRDYFNTSIDPRDKKSFEEIQGRWNQICGLPKESTEQALFFLIAAETRFVPFGIYCKGQLFPLAFESSYGKGFVSDYVNIQSFESLDQAATRALREKPTLETLVRHGELKSNKKNRAGKE